MQARGAGMGVPGTADTSLPEAKRLPQQTLDRVQCSVEADVAATGRRVKYSSRQKIVKGEDVLFVDGGAGSAQGAPSWALYGICDGHTGLDAALYVRDNLWRVLRRLLPQASLPDYKSPGFGAFAMQVRIAMVNAIMQVGQRCANFISGTTVTCALLCGRLLTLVNVGDSDAIVDIGTETFLATVSHRLEDNVNECERLKAVGVHVASLSATLTRLAAQGEEGIGPLRCWPGGLALSRSIGDVKAGSYIIPCPHISQMTLPESGGRIILGSDGLWDMICWEDAARVSRQSPVVDAATKVINTALIQNDWSSHDDATILIVDILPPDGGEFPKLVKQKSTRAANKKKALSQRCLAACLCSNPNSHIAIDLESQCDEMQVVAYVDGLELLRQTEQLLPQHGSLSLPELTSEAQMICSDAGPVHAPRGQKAAGYWCPERLGRHKDSDQRMPDTNVPTALPVSGAPVGPSFLWGQAGFVPFQHESTIFTKEDSFQRIPFSTHHLSGVGIPYSERHSFEHLSLHDHRWSYSQPRRKHPTTVIPYSNPRIPIDRKTSLDQARLPAHRWVQAQPLSTESDFANPSSSVKGHYEGRMSFDHGRLQRRW